MKNPPFYYSYLNLRVQLLLRQNLLIKIINNSKMSFHLQEPLSHDDLDILKQQLLGSHAFSNNDVETEKGSNWNQAIAHKGGTNPESSEPHLKKIKLKQHIKTEAPITPQKNNKARMRTSPNGQTPPLGEKNMNLPAKKTFKHKNNLTEFIPINEVQRKNTNHFKTMYTELYPSPKKRSLPYSSIHKESIQIRQPSKSEERSISKSKKKIHFTVYQSRKKQKGKQSPAKEQKIQPKKVDFYLPYRYNNSITINLFQEKIRDSKSKDQQSNIKKSLKSIPKQKPTTSIKKREGVSKSLRKGLNEHQYEEKINRVLEKIQKYKFVREYIEKWEILEKIEGYIKSNQPECKWPLLIVDQIFKRIRQENKFEAYVSK